MKTVYTIIVTRGSILNFLDDKEKIKELFSFKSKEHFNTDLKWLQKSNKYICNIERDDVQIGDIYYNNNTSYYIVFWVYNQLYSHWNSSDGKFITPSYDSREYNLCTLLYEKVQTLNYNQTYTFDNEENLLVIENVSNNCCCSPTQDLLCEDDNTLALIETVPTPFISKETPDDFEKIIKEKLKLINNLIEY